jgi:hypothetical protein
MRPIKPDRKPRKSNGAANRVLKLTPAIRTAAKELVRAYDAFDLDALERDNLDVVSLRFATPGGLDRADELVHGLPGVDSELLAQCRRCLHSGFKPLREHVEALVASLRNLASDSQQAAGLASLNQKLDALGQHAKRLEDKFTHQRDLVDER